MTEQLIFNILALVAGFIAGLCFIKHKHNLQKVSLKQQEQELNDREQELEIAEKESIESVVEKIKDIDKTIADKVLEIQKMNTVVFECPCNHNNIAVFIDLSQDENTFICPECKNEYRIDITMMPILKGRIIDEHNMYSLLAEKAGKNPFKNN